jgi:NADH-quinone oxidoreductase subunit G
MTAATAPTRNLDGIDAAIAEELPEMAAILRAAPGSSFRLIGRKIARGANRESGRTSMYADIEPREPDPATDPDSALAYSMEGPRGAPPPLLSRYWAPGWNSDQAINKFQTEAGGPLRGGEIGARLFASEIDRGALREAAEAGGQAMPDAFARRADALLIVPRSQSFGGEELSARSPAIASRIPEARLFLSVPDAGRLGLIDGKLAELSFLEADEGLGPGQKATSLVVPVQIADLPEGVASLPWIFPTESSPAMPGPAWATVRPLAKGII